MEVELKYTIKDDKTLDDLWQDKDLQAIEESESREIEDFKGYYYDTEDYDLLKNSIAFRVRDEGGKIVASLKWNGDNEGPLHTREELNITLSQMSQTPNPEIFKESEMGAKLLPLLEGKCLKQIMEVNVLRKSFRVDTGKGLFEISLDMGEIITKKGSALIREVEIELFSGSKEELVVLGEKLRERYGLVPEKDSKFARGLMLLELLDQ